MKTSRFTDSQIVSILKQHKEGVAVVDLCREHGMSQASFYKWRSKYGGANVNLIRLIKESKAENVRLKRALAESKLRQSIYKEALKIK